jgi:hypothetical protein
MWIEMNTCVSKQGLKLYKARISTEYSIVEIRQNEHQPNYMDSSGIALQQQQQH